MTYKIDKRVVVSADDIMVWSDDMLGATWCYRHELEEMSHMSDDYTTLYLDSEDWLKHEANV